MPTRVAVRHKLVIQRGQRECFTQSEFDIGRIVFGELVLACNRKDLVKSYAGLDWVNRAIVRSPRWLATGKWRRHQVSWVLTLRLASFWSLYEFTSVHQAQALWPQTGFASRGANERCYLVLPVPASQFRKLDTLRPAKF